MQFDGWPVTRHERLCPQCNSQTLTPLGRVTADGNGVRVAYRCGECSSEFELAVRGQIGGR